MGKAYIKVNSVTHAIKAKDVLNSNGIRAQITRNSINGKNESCGYLVTIDSDITRAEKVLQGYHIKTSGSGYLRDAQ